ncbi:hypothetical protein [Oceaniglobus roseus]|uniref:hypothetical protein n=1 Tax=Oceaniglobus roseus TaxID=1737570 RepID=UPI000C7EEE9D|nr:hypothetical protein [Kandeliimicrobium roseum]
MIERGVKPAGMRPTAVQILDRGLCNSMTMEGHAKNASQPVNQAAAVFQLSDEDAPPRTP